MPKPAIDIMKKRKRFPFSRAITKGLTALMLLSSVIPARASVGAPGKMMPNNKKFSRAFTLARMSSEQVNALRYEVAEDYAELVSGKKFDINPNVAFQIDHAQNSAEIKDIVAAELEIPVNAKSAYEVAMADTVLKKDIEQRAFKNLQIRLPAQLLDTALKRKLPLLKTPQELQAVEDSLSAEENTVVTPQLLMKAADHTIRSYEGMSPKPKKVAGQLTVFGLTQGSHPHLNLYHLSFSQAREIAADQHGAPLLNKKVIPANKPMTEGFAEFAFDMLYHMGDNNEVVKAIRNSHNIEELAEYRQHRNDRIIARKIAKAEHIKDPKKRAHAIHEWKGWARNWRDRTTDELAHGQAIDRQNHEIYLASHDRQQKDLQVIQNEFAQQKQNVFASMQQENEQAVDSKMQELDTAILISNLEQQTPLGQPEQHVVKIHEEFRDTTQHVFGNSYTSTATMGGMKFAYNYV
jgi:hypothetical protein